MSKSDGIVCFMSRPNGFVFPFIICLISTSLFSQKLGSTVQAQSLVNRADPLQHFKAYNGSYDVRNKHYWASAAFRGVHGYAIAGLWMLFGLGFGSYVILKNFSGSSSSVSTLPDSFYLVIVSLIVLFTLLAIVATGVILAANQSSLQRAKRVRETIFGAGSDACRTISTVTKALQNMETLLRPYDEKAYRLLNYSTHRLGRESQMIQSFADKNRRSSNLAFESLYLANAVVVTVNLVLLVAALVLLFLHWQPGFTVIIFLCWILTALSWVMTGFDFFFRTFVEDTCSAFENFLQNPEQSSLTSMLPCTNSSSADKILVTIGYTIHNFISQLNLKIKTVEKVLGLDEQKDGDSSGFTGVCDPFPGSSNYSYAPETCPQDAIAISELPNVLSQFTCYKGNLTQNCERDGRFLPEDSYFRAWAYSQSVQDMINVYPDLQSLTWCSGVKDALSDVVLRQCKPFIVSVHMLWASMLSLSVFMVVLVLLWTSKAYQDRGRSYSTCSVVPKSP